MGAGQGFSAELAAATTVVLASRTGIPVSTTHIAVGAVMGVGLARGIGALNLRVIGGIFMSWVITLPVGALLSIFFFFFFRGLFLLFLSVFFNGLSVCFNGLG